ncbi:unnamed protein product [Closterium sp. NIES-54]
MVHFMPTTTDVSAEDTAKLFVTHVFRLHGLPRVMVSDRDPRFTSRFWQEVIKTLGTKLKMSSAFHPQTDGQTERTNRTLEQMLRSFISPTQDDWDELLPVVEFAVNNSVHESTHEKPFVLNSGRHPTTPATHGIKNLKIPAAKDFIGNQQAALKSARHWLQLAQQRQNSYADMKCREVVFAVGDKVLLSTKNIRLKIPGARKLFPRWIGPFKVIARVEGKYLPPPTIALEEELFYEVERVLTHRNRQRGRKTVREFLIQWKGYGPEHNSWEPEEHLTEVAVQAYMEDLALRAGPQPVDGVDPGRNVVRRARSTRPQKHPRATGTLPPWGGGV